MRYLVLLLLLFCIEGKAQSYTFTLNECRVEATTGELRESFLVDRIRYFDRGDQTFIFDHESVLSVFDANITNYGRDSLKALIDIWIDSCNVVPIPTPPAPTALFANTTSLDLDGATELVTVPDPLDVFSFTDGAGNDEPFSASIWVYENTLLGNYLIKLIPPNYEWYLYRAGNNIVVRLYSGGTFTSYLQILHTRTTTNEWFHLAITYDGSELQSGLNMYVDGVNVGTKSTVGTYLGMSITGVNLRICDVTDGKIDQPTVFNKELTVSEIKELMALRDYSYFSDTASIVSSWYMDAPDDLGVAGGVTDRFGSNDGTGVNTTTADNLVECIEYPYDYQLDSSALYTNLTPFQDDSASAEMGFAWDFDGTNERIELSNAAAFQFSTSFTISAWVYKTVTTAGADEIFSKYKTTGNLRSYSLSIQPGDVIQLAFGDPADGTFEGTSKSDVSIPLNQWTHIMVTYNAGAVVMYINGESVTTTDVTVPSSLYNTSTIALIGCGQTSSYAQFFDGKIDEVILSNQVFTATDALTLYNSHGLIDPRDTDLSANIVGYWNGYNSTNTASGVLDLSGNGNNGTPTNMDLADFQYDSPRAIFEADSSASFSLDGATEYITVPNPADSSLSFNGNAVDVPYSLSAWIYCVDATQFRIFSKATSGIEYFWGTDGSDKLVLFMYDSGGTSRIFSTGSAIVPENKWVFVTATYDGSETKEGITTYINGIASTMVGGSVGTYLGMTTTASPLNIGELNTGTPSYANGKISHATVYDTELTLCEIQEIFNDGSPVDPRLTTVSANVISHWRLNSGDDVNGTVLDIVGSNNGTSVNAPTLDETSYPTN